MKIRTGFVSNSSSSSFLIGVKSADKKDLEKELATAFALPKGHPMSNLTTEVIKQIVSGISRDNVVTSKQAFLKDAFGEEDYDEDPGPFAKKVFAALDRGLTVYTGEFYDDATPDIDLTGAGFDVDTPDFVLWSEEGY